MKSKKKLSKEVEDQLIIYHELCRACLRAELSKPYEQYDRAAVAECVDEMKRSYALLNNNVYLDYRHFDAFKDYLVNLNIFDYIKLQINLKDLDKKYSKRQD